MFNKKNVGFFIIVLLLFLFFTNTSCYAEEDYKIWNSGQSTIVQADKVWSITFNKDVSVDSAKDFISIYREDTNEKVQLDFSNGTSSKSIKVSPKVSYEKGKNYVLIVNSGLSSIDGKKIEQPIKYNFKIEEEGKTDDTPADNSTIETYEEYYNAVKNALINYEPSITLSISNYDKDIYNLDVIDKIVNENTELMGIFTGASGSVKSTTPVEFTIKFNYSDTKENLIVKEKAVQEKTQEIVSKETNSTMKDYEKELALHDYIVNNCKYDQRNDIPKDSYTAYGVLIDGIGVCQGYAEAMDRLLKGAGIETKIIVGEASGENGWEGHAWNLVKIGGEYYHLDATWDDPVTTDSSNELSHSYFNITDEQIEKDHKWNKTDYPSCTNTTYNFYNLDLPEKDSYGNNIITIKSYDEFFNAIKNAVAEGSPTVSVRILNYDANEYNVSKTVKNIYKSFSKYGEFGWNHYNDDINNVEYITIMFK